MAAERSRPAGSVDGRIVPGVRGLAAGPDRLSPMAGPIALVGAGEFLPAMAAFDRGLLEATGRARPRVAIVPTAAYPDGEEVFARWAAMGRAHFESLGAEVEEVLLRGRADADDEGHAQALGEADLLYFSGGKPGHLLDTLVGSAAWAAALGAHRRGAVLAGCSAGAMVLAERVVGVRRRLPFPVRWEPGLGIAEGLAVLPHYDAWPEVLAAALALRAPAGLVVLGIDEETAVVGRDGSWQVHGRGRVTVWRGRHRQRQRQGDVFPI